MSKFIDTRFNQNILSSKGSGTPGESIVYLVGHKTRLEKCRSASLLALKDLSNLQLHWPVCVCSCHHDRPPVAVGSGSYENQEALHLRPKTFTALFLWFFSSRFQNQGYKM